MRGARVDAIRLGTVWQRMTGLMDEVAQTFVRTSFSIVVRENWDLACSLLDRDGRQFAQSSRSIPSFLGTVPTTLAAMLAVCPRETLVPGDVLISNDSWIGTGHLNDITTAAPIFRRGALVGFVASTFHTVDIGGAPSPTARDCFEEGICIPICRIRRAGAEDPVVVAFLEQNLREPAETLGDIRAQFAAFDLAAQRLVRILDEEGIDDLQQVTDEILDRSEASMRAALLAVPDGVYRHRVTADGFEHPLTIACTVRKSGDGIAVDYAGTSDQVDRPVNSVLNFTVAYSAYTLKCLLDPATPNNEGMLRPMAITAPAGSLVNPRRPAPVWGRHLSGHYMPFAILGALAPALPERVVADAGSPQWNVYFKGLDRRGRRFVRMYFMNGGFGARPGSDGPACLSFPSNVANTPVEQFENATPLLITEKALIPGSGGAGRFRGGAGQRLSFRSTSEAPVNFVIRHERVLHPPQGLNGGGPGRAGVDLLNGERIPGKSALTLQRGDVVTFETPGGGGMGPAAERDPAQLAQDALDGLAGP